MPGTNTKKRAAIAGQAQQVRQVTFGAIEISHKRLFDRDVSGICLVATSEALRRRAL